jgi:hypothetical protein
MAISGEMFEFGLRFFEIGSRAIKPTKARLGARYHSGQWLLYLMSDHGRHRIARHQPRLTLATLRNERVEQPRLHCRYLVQEENEHEGT